MKLIQKQIGLEDIISRIPSLFPYIDFDIYGDTPIYNGLNDDQGLGILHIATDGEQGSYGHIMGSFIMPQDAELYDNAVLYYPITYINSEEEVISKYEYDELSLYGRDCYAPYDDNALEGCDKYSYVPSEYKNLITDESIDAVTYRSKTKRSRYNYNVYECSNGDKIIKLNDYLVDEVMINGEKYKVLSFLRERNTAEVTIPTDATTNNYEVYFVSLKRQIIKPGETYSYRTMMNAYYAHYKDRVQSDYKQYSYVLPGGIDVTDYRRWVNLNNKTDIIEYIDYHLLEEEKQTFIKFIERAIGRYTIEECVKKYNDAHVSITAEPTYLLSSNQEISYTDFANSLFENIADVYEPSEYVKIDKTGDSANVYLYTNKIDGRTITKDEYNELDEYGAVSCEPKTYRLNNGDVESNDYEISVDTYDSLRFYGQTSYTEYEYISSEILTTEEYSNLSDGVKAEYCPYTYFNVNDFTDIISKDIYDTISKNKKLASNYRVYRYIKCEYTTIFAYEYNDLLPEYKENYFVFTYTNKSKANDIITAEEYNNLTEYGRMDYGIVDFINANGNTISVDDYYKLNDYGKDDYVESGYYNTTDTITKREYIEQNKPKNYKPFVYSPKERIENISLQQYTALPMYGFKYYVPYEYYTMVDIASEGEEPTYQQVIITADEYNDDTYWETTSGLKEDYEPYTYIPSNLGEDDDIEKYIVSYTDYDELPYFGQSDYNEIGGEETVDSINFEEDYENLFKDWEELKYRCPSLVNGVIYLAQIDGILYEMKNLKKMYFLLENSDLENKDEIKCEYSKYLRMGGDHMIMLLEWLKQEANAVATEMMTYASIKNYVNIPINLSLTLQDNGYYTPAMNYKDVGMTVYKGEPFTYVNESGIADTYVYVGQNQEAIFELGSDNFKLLKDYEITRVRQEMDNNTIVTLTGQLDSKLKTLKSRRTYLNYFGQVETPSYDEDWLWYYVKGAIYDISTITDNGEIVKIPDSLPTDTDNLLAYGSVLTDIKADNTDCTLTFTYYTDAHLKIVKTEEKTTRIQYTEEEYEYYKGKYGNNVVILYKKDGSDSEIKQSEYDSLEDEEKALYVPYEIEIKYREQFFTIDTDSKYGEYHGVKYTETYNYERYGEIYDLVLNNGFEDYINNTERSFEKYAFNSSPNNVQRKVLDTYVVDVPYISSNFEYTFDYEENIKNELCSVIYKEDLLNGIHYKPIVDNQAFILRGTSAAFERHLRLGEVKTLEDLENYHNGSFFNIINNF